MSDDKTCAKCKRPVPTQAQWDNDCPNTTTDGTCKCAKCCAMCWGDPIDCTRELQKKCTADHRHEGWNCYTPSPESAPRTDGAVVLPGVVEHIERKFAPEIASLQERLTRAERMIEAVLAEKETLRRELVAALLTIEDLRAGEGGK